VRRSEQLFFPLFFFPSWTRARGFFLGEKKEEEKRLSSLFPSFSFFRFFPRREAPFFSFFFPFRVARRDGVERRFSFSPSPWDEAGRPHSFSFFPFRPVEAIPQLQWPGVGPFSFFFFFVSFPLEEAHGPPFPPFFPACRGERSRKVKDPFLFFFFFFRFPLRRTKVAFPLFFFFFSETS